MKINKIITPIESAANALFKNTIGNDLGQKKSYTLTQDFNQDIFVKETNTSKKHTCKSKSRRKW